MRFWVLACAMVASLAWPAFAKDFALPAKGPAVTLTIPDNWDITELENEVATIAPDGYLVFTVGFGKRSELDALIRASKAYLKESKVTLNVKPVESTMNFAGTTAWAQRYATKGQNGKTIVDLITVEASRDRVVLITVMGSTEERKDNEAALAGIMSSIRFPGEVAAPTAQPAAPQPPRAAIASPPPMTAAAPAPPFAVRRALFVKRRPQSFGDADPRAADAFAPGEALLSYIEPVGQAMLPADTGRKRFGVIVDFEIRTRDGKVLGGQKAMLDRDLTTPGDGSDPKFYIDGKVDLTGAEPGAYVLTYILRDKLSDRVTSVDQPFTIGAAPAPAARPADVGCANPVAREGMIAAVNQRPAFRDAKKTLKALADPEVVKDARPKSLTCRYTAIIAETGGSGLIETRQRITFVMTTDDNGEVDADYTIE